MTGKIPKFESGTLQEAIDQARKFDQLVKPHSELIRQVSSANSPLRDMVKQATELQRFADPSRDLKKLLNDFSLTGAGGNPPALPRTVSPPARYPDKHAITTPSHLGALIKASRVAKKLTQQQLADLAGVGRRFIVECEAGKPRLEFAKVLQVAAAAGIDIFAVKR